MNFTTDLPKINPCVKYLVATGKLKSTCYRMHVVVLASKYSRKDTLAEVTEMMKFQAEERVIMCHILRLSTGNHCKSSRKSRKYLKNDFNLSDDCELKIDQLEKKFEEKMGKTCKQNTKQSIKKKCFKSNSKSISIVDCCEKEDLGSAEQFANEILQSPEDLEDQNCIIIQPIAMRTRSQKIPSKTTQSKAKTKYTKSKEKLKYKRKKCQLPADLVHQNPPRNKSLKISKLNLNSDTNQGSDSKEERKSFNKESKPEKLELFSESSDRNSDLFIDNKYKNYECCSEAREQFEKRSLLKYFYTFAASKDKVLANMVANEGMRIISQFDSYSPCCQCQNCNKLLVSPPQYKIQNSRSNQECSGSKAEKIRLNDFHEYSGIDNNCSPQSFLSKFNS